MVILPKLVKILWRLPTLSGCSLPSRGATVLGACSMARALHSDGSRFLNFCKTPLQAWETSVWTQMSDFHQFWRNSTDGSPLWMAIARPPEVQLTWVLFLWQANVKLKILGFWIFAKLHSRPEICAFENDWQNLPLLPHFSFSFDGYFVWQAIARSTEVQLTQVLFLQLENSQLMILGTGSASKVHSKPDL